MPILYIYDLYDNNKQNEIEKEDTKKINDNSIIENNSKLDTKTSSEINVLAKNMGHVDENLPELPTITPILHKTTEQNEKSEKSEKNEKTEKTENDNIHPLNSIFQLKCISSPNNPMIPWVKTGMGELDSSSFLIKFPIKLPEDNKIKMHYFCVSNAHAVKSCIDGPNGKKIVSLVSSARDNFEGTLRAVNNFCDISLIQVDNVDDVYKKNAIEIFGNKNSNISKMNFLDRNTKISIYGYPFGDKVMSVSSGSINSVLSQTYAFYGKQGIVYSIDASCNQGNSGGPLYDADTKSFAGIVFEGKGSNTAYAIPREVLEKTVERFKNLCKSSKGNSFLTLKPLVHNLNIQNLENKNTRNYFDIDNILLKEKITKSLNSNLGIRIKSMPKVIEENTQLKTEDILLEVNGMKIKSDQTFILNNEALDLEALDMFATENNNEVKFKVLRYDDIDANKKDYKILDLVHKYDYPQNLVDKSLCSENNEFVVVGGGVYVNLTPGVIKAACTGDGISLPIDELSLIKNGNKSQKNQHVIILSTFLPSTLTSENLNYKNVIVDSINGKKINSLIDVIVAASTTKNFMTIKNNENELICVEFPNSFQEDNKQILREVCVPLNGCNISQINQNQCECAQNKHISYNSDTNYICCLTCKKDLLSLNKTEKVTEKIMEKEKEKEKNEENEIKAAVGNLGRLILTGKSQVE